VVFGLSVFADQTIFQPVIYSTGSSLTLQSGITTTFASGSITDFNAGSTVDFTGATVTGLATGSGTVTSFSAGDLSPLFTTTETNPTTTPALSFVLSTAAANTVFGNNTGSTAAPAFQTLVDAQVPDILTLTRASNLTSNGFVKTSGGIGTLSVDTSTYLTGNQTITLTGDTTGTGATCIATVNAKVNGVTYPASPSTNTVPVVTSSNTVTYQAVPTTAGGAPTGGTANQVMSKIDGTNYNTQWATQSFSNLSGAASALQRAEWVNSSITSVSAAYATDTYLAGSSVVVGAGNWAAGGQYSCTFDLSKTAAGTATFIINIRAGVNGSIADASIGTITLLAGTANADSGVITVRFNLRAIGASANGAYYITLLHSTASTGIASVGLFAMSTPAGSSNFNSTTATTLGLSINGGASFSGTTTTVQTAYMQ
jgi:hypothetical protein